MTIVRPPPRAAALLPKDKPMNQIAESWPAVGQCRKSLYQCKHWCVVFPSKNCTNSFRYTTLSTLRSNIHCAWKSSVISVSMYKLYMFLHESFPVDNLCTLRMGRGMIYKNEGRLWRKGGPCRPWQCMAGLCLVLHESARLGHCLHMLGR
jgi:hypothetical protein